MDDPTRIPALEQELRDERARRRKAEARTEELAARADVWRRRAEERAERIDRIRSRLRRGAGRRPATTPPGASGDGHVARGEPQKVTAESPSRAAAGAGATEATPDDREPIPGGVPSTRSRPGIPAIRAVTAVGDPGMARGLAAFGAVDLASVSPADLDGADLVVVDPATIRGDTERARRLGVWAAEPGRSRLVVWATGPDLGDVVDMLVPGDVVAATTADLAARLAPLAGVAVHHLPGCLDPSLHRPSGPPVDSPETGEERRDGARIVLGADGPIRIEGADGLLGDPPLWLIELAATGVPLATGTSGDAVPHGAGTAARRWAYRNHAPWVRARRLLEIAGVDAPRPGPRVAGILVSNRPDDTAAAIAGFLRQTHPDLELVVGLHGSPMTADIERALAAATIPVVVLELDRSLVLGECLNRAIAATSAPVLAKIDDDDHYGPGHIEDSVHALAYGGADIVGKGAQYTFVEGRDTTVLRRPRQEEMLIDGSPNGATLVFRRSVWEEVGFPHRPRHVDTGFLRAARSIGARVYAGSRWEFCYVRRRSGHTWTADEAVFFAGSEPAWDGFHPERVEVADVAAI